MVSGGQFLDPKQIRINDPKQLESPRQAEALDGGVSLRVSEHPLFQEVKLTVMPKQGTDPLSQLRSCLTQMDEQLSQMSLSKEFLTLDSTYSNADPQQLQKVMADHYRGSQPTTSHVGEMPLDGPQIVTEHMVLVPKGGKIKISTEQMTLSNGQTFEVQVLETDEVKITKKAVYHEKYGLARYTVVEGKKEDFKRVHAAGLTGGPGDIAESSRGAFEQQKMILEAEGMELPDILCQRNFIEDIDGPNYHIFNEIRRQYYGDAFKKGDPHLDWPAATGIGQDRNGVVIKFVAEKSNRVRHCIDNPKQTRSDSYLAAFQADQAVTGGTGQKIGSPLDHQGVGINKKRPAFSRALAIIVPNPEDYAEGEVIGELFISGTASISGQKFSGDPDIPYVKKTFQPQYVDVSSLTKLIGRQALEESGLKLDPKSDRIFAETATEAQAIDTLERTALLTSRENLQNHGIPGYVEPAGLKRMRYYVKEPEEYHIAKKVIDGLLKGAPGFFPKADVCYADLYYESGGVVEVLKSGVVEVLKSEDKPLLHHMN